ncbi:MAG: CCA tRNA nucleotidyltransferase [Variibacter sp.]|nr:CCA tRNA nucleotidyltransferase [Variibacter sp.]
MTATVHSLASASWLTAGPAAKLLRVLNRNGEEARVIGGAVRNALLGHQPGDIDVATTATPEEVMRRAAQDGMKAVPTGIEHGTVTVVVDGHPIEVTSLREDVETFGRKAAVRFGRDWRVDAERRDFTINALSAGPDGVVVDYVGGLADLAARRVRFIGDAATRIREDYLRILRFFRFHAGYGAGDPDAAGLHACIVLRDGLALLSRERVRSEIMKLLVQPRAVTTVRIMAEGGLIEPVLGVVLVSQLDRLAEAEARLRLAPDATLRLGALALHGPDDGERLAQRLRLSNAEHDRLVSMASRWWQISPALGASARRALLYRLGPPRFRDRVLFAWSKAGATAEDSGWSELATLPARWQAPRFPLQAADFIAAGVAKGPALGQALAAAEEAWIAGDFAADDATLKALVRAGAAKFAAQASPRE